jgi:hypothetical protein
MCENENAILELAFRLACLLLPASTLMHVLLLSNMSECKERKSVKHYNAQRIGEDGRENELI